MESLFVLTVNFVHSANQKLSPWLLFNKSIQLQNTAKTNVHKSDKVTAEFYALQEQNIKVNGMSYNFYSNRND